MASVWPGWRGTIRTCRGWGRNCGLPTSTRPARPATPSRVAGGESESIFQPEWSPDGVLYFISDRTNWWNLYRWQDGQIIPLCPLEAEFGQPQWVFGMSTYAFADARTIVCEYTQKGLGKLATLDVVSRQLSPIELPYTDFSQIRAAGKLAAFRAGAPSRPPSVVLLDLATRTHRVLRKASPVADDPTIKPYFTQVQPIAFETTGGKPGLRPVLSAPQSRLSRTRGRQAAARREGPRRSDCGSQAARSICESNIGPAAGSPCWT